MDLEQPLYRQPPWHVRILAAAAIGLFAVGICAAPYLGSAAIRSAISPRAATPPARAAAEPSAPLAPTLAVRDSFLITSSADIRGMKLPRSPAVYRFFCDRPAPLSTNF